MKALIVYGTRGGATRAIAEEIGKALAGSGYETTVEDVRETKGVDVNAFDLVIVGSSVWAGMWTGKATGFVKSNQEVLAGKKVAFFSSGITGTDPEKVAEANRSLEKSAESFPTIKPVALAFFGGYFDFNTPNLIARLTGSVIKKDLEKKGVDTSKPYDTRDFPAIHQWATDLASKAG
jgi:menaquinone-dependent protoporphyrinogen oxidase